MLGEQGKKKELVKIDDKISAWMVIYPCYTDECVTSGTVMKDATIFNRACLQQAANLSSSSDIFR